MLIFVAVILAGFAVERIVAGWSPPTGDVKPPADLVVAADHLHFGEVWETDRFQWTLPVHNRGKDHRTITGFFNSCNCTTILPESMELPAGATQDLRLTLSLSRDGTDRLTPFPFRVELAPRFDGSDRHDSPWVIEGTVRPTVRFATRIIDFGTLSDLDRRPKGVAVDARVATEVVRVAVAADDGFTVTETEIRPGPDGRLNVTVLPDSDRSRGLREGTLSLTPFLADGRPLPVRTLPLRVRVVGDIRADPSVLAFSQQVGERAEQIVSLSSLTGQSFVPESVRVSVRGGSVSAAVVEGSDRQVRVTCSPDEAGSFSGSIAVRCKRADGSHVDVEVPVAGYGLPVRK